MLKHGFWLAVSTPTSQFKANVKYPCQITQYTPDKIPSKVLEVCVEDTHMPFFSQQQGIAYSQLNLFHQWHKYSNTFQYKDAML